MKITKKHAIIGIIVIILIGVGFSFLGGQQNEDSSADIKSKELTNDVKDDIDVGAKDNDGESYNADKKSNATSEKKDTSKNNSNNGDKNNSNNSNKNNSNSGNSSGSSSNTPSKPAHTHSWTAVYFTNYKFVGEASICSTCGATITGSEASHAKQHNMKGENGGHYSEPIYEPYQEIDYYKCSCGATK